LLVSILLLILTAHPTSLSATEPLCRLDELVIQEGMAVVRYDGIDSRKQGTGLRAVSHGKVRNTAGQDIYSVWRVRNASDTNKEVYVDGYQSSFHLTFTAAAYTKTFFRSDFAAGSATHRLFYNGTQIDVNTLICQELSPTAGGVASAKVQTGLVELRNLQS
jgi:hypothetical protein